jgi:glycine cleavage system transcriptional repressor
MQKQHVVATFVGEDKSGLVDAIFKIAAKSKCHIDVCRAVSVADSFVIIVFLSGTWNTLAKFEAGVPKLKSKFSIRANVNPSEAIRRAQVVPYYAQLTILRKDPVALSQCIEYLTVLGNIYDVRVETYSHERSKLKGQIATIFLDIPVNMIIAEIREEFIGLCEELNIEGLLEPDSQIPH